MILSSGDGSQAVLPGSAVVAGFEIGMLLRCARTGTGRYERSATEFRATEFSRPDAAARLTVLLGDLGLAATRIDYAAGGRHRYTVHRVVCPALPEWPLARAWLLGHQRLFGSDEYRTTRQRRHRADLAEAAWRAAVLSGGLRGGAGRSGTGRSGTGRSGTGRSSPLAVRAPDTDVAGILVRAARILDAPARLHSVAGRHVVEVTPGAAELALRQLAVVEPVPARAFAS